MPKVNHTIFVADDDADDFFLLEDTFADIKSPHLLTHFTNGEVLLSEMLCCPADKLPILVMLDINMPKMDGIKTLVMLRSIAGLSHIPVIMHTTSASEQQMNLCYNSGANGFITKGNTLSSVRNLAAQIDQFLSILSDQITNATVTNLTFFNNKKNTL